MKNRILLGSLVIVAGTMMIQPSFASEVKLNAASFQPETVVFARYFFRLVRETNRRCAGLLSIKVLDHGTIAANRQWHALKTGAIDIYFGPANYYRGLLSQADVLNIAHKTPAEQRQNGAWGILNKLHNEHLNAWYLTTILGGVKFHIYTTKPIKNGRFDGLRLRSVPLFRIAMEALGAETRQMAAKDVKAALEKDRIDGFGWPLWGLDVLGWQKLVRYRLEPGFMNAAAPVLINLKKWNSLPNTGRDCLNKSALWLEREWPAWREAEDRRALATQQRARIKRVEGGENFSERTETIYWRMLKTASPDFVKRIRPLL